MNDYQLEDLLDIHSRALPRAGPGARAAQDGPLETRQSGPEGGNLGLGEAALTLAPLLLLAQEIAALLVPIRPRGEFRRALRHSLMAHARQQQAQRLLNMPTAGPGTLASPYFTAKVMGWISQETTYLAAGRRWMWGAAAVGSAVSLAGVLAYMLSHRGKPAASA